MRTSRRKKYVIAGVAALLIISWVVYARTKAAQSNKPIIQTATVEKGMVVSTVSASGVLEPLTTVDLKSNAGGRVDVLAVDVGSVVTAGQLIAKIDPTDTQTALNQAEADLSAANARLSQSKESLILQAEQNDSQVKQAEEAYSGSKARLAQAESQAKAQPALTQASIRQAEANHKSAQESLRQLKSAGIPLGTAQAKAAYDQAKATLDRAKRNLDRQKELHDKGFVSTNLLESARLEYQTAQAQYNSASERMSTVKVDYDAQFRAAEARVEQTQAALANAKVNAVQDKIRQQEVAAARSAVKQAEASLAAAKADARQVPIRAADIQASAAQVVRSKAQVDNARTQLDYTTVTAPRDGIILQKYVEVGTIITSGRSSFAGTGAGTSIIQLGDCSRMFVRASVDETDIAQVRVGQSVDVLLDAYPQKRFPGLVTKIDPQTVVEQNVTTVPVTVEILKPDPRLKPGMNATCDFIVERKVGVLAVPSEAVVEKDRGRQTVTVMENGKQVEREVKVGIVGDESTEIISGLREGDKIVTNVLDPQAAGQQGFGGNGGSRRPTGPMGMGRPH